MPPVILLGEQRVDFRVERGHCGCEPRRFGRARPMGNAIGQFSGLNLLQFAFGRRAVREEPLADEFPDEAMALPPRPLFGLEQPLFRRRDVVAEVGERQTAPAFGAIPRRQCRSLHAGGLVWIRRQTRRDGADVRQSLGADLGREERHTQHAVERTPIRRLDHVVEPFRFFEVGERDLLVGFGPLATFAFEIGEGRLRRGFQESDGVGRFRGGFETRDQRIRVLRRQCAPVLAQPAGVEGQAGEGAVPELERGGDDLGRAPGDRVALVRLREFGFRIDPRFRIADEQTIFPEAAEFVGPVDDRARPPLDLFRVRIDAGLRIADPRGLFGCAAEADHPRQQFDAGPFALGRFEVLIQHPHEVPLDRAAVEIAVDQLEDFVRDLDILRRRADIAEFVEHDSRPNHALRGVGRFAPRPEPNFGAGVRGRGRPNRLEIVFRNCKRNVAKGRAGGECGRQMDDGDGGRAQLFPEDLDLRRDRRGVRPRQSDEPFPAEQ